MKLSVNVVIQILGLAGQAVTAVSDILPPRARVWAFVALSAIQGISGVLAHFANPDGTPASVAYQK